MCRLSPDRRNSRTDRDSWHPPACSVHKWHRFCQIKYTPYPKAWDYPNEVCHKAIQEMVDEAPKAKRYYNDAFDVYDRLWYHLGAYEVSRGKANTYSVEVGNAELRHYLARLTRRTSCFSR